jgi:hypothetical protein
MDGIFKSLKVIGNNDAISSWTTPSIELEIMPGLLVLLGWRTGGNPTGNDNGVNKGKIDIDFTKWEVEDFLKEVMKLKD